MVTTSGRVGIVCGVDVGTTNCKVVALGRDGRVVARATRPTPRNESDVSIDAESLLAALEDMIVEVCSDAYSVHAVACAGIGEDGVLVSPDLEPLGDALAWFDPRRARLFRSLEPLLASTPDPGVSTDASRSLVGWLWASQHDDLDRAATWVALTDFAAVRWSGAAFMSDTLAARTSAWTTATRDWIGERVTATLGDPRLLPPVVATGAIVGHLTSSRLRAAGVVAGDALVVAGGHDHPIGGWGVGLRHPGAILDSMGTAEVVVAQHPAADLGAVGSIDVEPGIRSAGRTLLRVEELSRNVTWAAQDPEVDAALQAIMRGDVAPDSHLESDAFRPGTRGGGRPSYAGDAPRAAHSRASAVLGALARTGTGAIAEVASTMPGPTAVYAAGGWARSPGWMTVKRRVAGYDLDVVAEPEVTAVGAALLAAAAIDWPVSPELALSAGLAGAAAGTAAGPAARSATSGRGDSR